MMPKTKAAASKGDGGGLDNLRDQLPFLALPDQKVDIDPYCCHQCCRNVSF